MVCMQAQSPSATCRSTRSDNLLAENTEVAIFLKAADLPADLTDHRQGYFHGQNVLDNDLLARQHVRVSKQNKSRSRWCNALPFSLEHRGEE